MKYIILSLLSILVVVIAGRNTEPIEDKYVSEIRFTSGYIDTVTLNYKPRICTGDGVSWLCDEYRNGTIQNVEFVRVLKFIPKKRKVNIKKKCIGRGQPY